MTQFRNGLRFDNAGNPITEMGAPRPGGKIDTLSGPITTHDPNDASTPQSPQSAPPPPTASVEAPAAPASGLSGGDGSVGGLPTAPAAAPKGIASDGGAAAVAGLQNAAPADPLSNIIFAGPATLRDGIGQRNPSPSASLAMSGLKSIY